MIIYKVTNTVNNKVYIGQTCNTLEYRRSQHERDCKYHRNSYFHEALLKYGFDKFVWEVIDSCNTQDGIDELEKMYIKEYRTTDKQFGYNLKQGGREGGLYNDECRKRLGESTKRKWQNPEIAAKMLAGLRKGTDTVKERAKNFWAVCTCEYCGKEFKVKPHQKRRFCSTKCSELGCREESIERLHKITQNSIEKFKRERDDKALIIYEWAKNNRDLVLKCPFNKISTTLKDLFTIVNAKDMRTIMICIGCTSKKEFLKKLKDYVLNN